MEASISLIVRRLNHRCNDV